MDSHLIDMEEVMERLQNDNDLLLELLHDFEHDYRKKRKIIDQLVKQQDLEKLKEAIHSLKGAAGNLAVKPMHSCCMVIEYLTTQKDIGLIKEVLHDIDQQFLEVQAFIERLKKGQVR